jgi:hypothetical protein
MLIRWESSSEGSNRRCISLAAKALIAAANSIQTLISIRFDSIYAMFFSAWFALIVVLNRTAHTVAIVLITARYANNLGMLQIPRLQQARSIRTLSIRMYSMQRMRQHDPLT